MSDFEQTIDDDPQLILVDGARVKKAFDPHIASLVLRPKTNNPAGGYSLAASAIFGSEIVHIPIMDENDERDLDSEIFEFRLQIFKAELVIDTAFCKIDALYENDKLDNNLIPISGLSVNNDRKRSTKINLDSGKALEDLTGVKIGLEHQFEESSNSSSDAWYEITALNDETIQFTSRGKRPVPLQGRLLDEFLGWRIIPRIGGPSGVLGRLRVRESWIELVDARPVGRQGRWTHKLTELLKGTGERYRYRKRAFDLLLSHLVAKGLQEGAETRDATMAADTVIVGPPANEFSRVETEQREDALKLAGHPIVSFLKSPFGEEKHILSAIGVPQARIEGLGPAPALIIEGDDDFPAPKSQLLIQFVEIYVDFVISNIKRSERSIDFFVKPLIYSIVGKEIDFDEFSKTELKSIELILSNKSCIKIVNAVKPPYGLKLNVAEYHFSEFRSDGGDCELLFSDLAGIVFGKDYSKHHLRDGPTMVELLIRNYQGREGYK